MNLSVNIEKYSINNIFFLDPIKNTVIDNSNFIRILYSTNLMTLNGIYLYITFNNVYLQHINNKIKYLIKYEPNKVMINYLKNLEEELLEHVNIKKRKVYKLGEQVQNGLVKIINNNYNNNIHINNYNNYILKISGIWESNLEYGLTYKFVDIFSLVI